MWVYRSQSMHVAAGKQGLTQVLITLRSHICPQSTSAAVRAVGWCFPIEPSAPLCVQSDARFVTRKQNVAIGTETNQWESCF